MPQDPLTAVALRWVTNPILEHVARSVTWHDAIIAATHLKDLSRYSLWELKPACPSLTTKPACAMAAEAAHHGLARTRNIGASVLAARRKPSLQIRTKLGQRPAVRVDLLIKGRPHSWRYAAMIPRYCTRGNVSLRRRLPSSMLSPCYLSFA